MIELAKIDAKVKHMKVMRDGIVIVGGKLVRPERAYTGLDASRADGYKQKPEQQTARRAVRNAFLVMLGYAWTLQFSWTEMPRRAVKRT